MSVALRTMIDEVLAYTAPELIAWKLVEKLKDRELLITGGEIYEIDEVDYRGFSGDNEVREEAQPVLTVSYRR